jgi:hypothetical protein
MSVGIYKRNATAGFMAGDDGAYGGNADAGDGFGNAGCWVGGEEELIVFAAVQSGLEGGCGGERLGERMERECGCVDAGGDARLVAEVGEVSGDAVGDVDAGCGEAAAQEGLADGEAGLREEVGGGRE